MQDFSLGPDVGRHADEVDLSRVPPDKAGLKALAASAEALSEPAISIGITMDRLMFIPYLRPSCR